MIFRMKILRCFPAKRNQNVSNTIRFPCWENWKRMRTSQPACKNALETAQDINPKENPFKQAMIGTI